MKTKVFHVLPKNSSTPNTKVALALDLQNNQIDADKVVEEYQPEENILAEIAKQLKQGEVVALPSETVYGLAAEIGQEKALAKIFALKKRPADNPLIVHVASKEKLKSLTSSYLPIVDFLIDKFSPGPITYVLPKKKEISDLITAGLDTVACRIPKHPIFHKLLKDYDLALAAPSANLSGSPSPTNIEHVISDFQGELGYIVDGGAAEEGVESTVIAFKINEPILDKEKSNFKDAQPKIFGTLAIYRPGSITKSDIEAALEEYYKLHAEKWQIEESYLKYAGAKSKEKQLTKEALSLKQGQNLASQSSAKSSEIEQGDKDNLLNQPPPSPGLKYKHYSPQARVKPYYWTFGFVNEKQISTNLKSSILEVLEKKAEFFSSSPTISLLIPDFWQDINISEITGGFELAASKAKIIPYYLTTETKPEDFYQNTDEALFLAKNLAFIRSCQKNIFAALRSLDAQKVDIIFVPSFAKIDNEVILNQARAYQNRIEKTFDFEFTLANAKYKEINFVCTGNTCRSPIAEHYFGKIVQEKQIELKNQLSQTNKLSPKWQELKAQLAYLQELKISSAGIYAGTNYPASVESIYFAHKILNLDLEKHRSKKLQLVYSQNPQVKQLILTMTVLQKQIIEQYLLEINKEKYEVKSIYEFLDNQERDIEDPYGRGNTTYEQMVYEVKEAMDRLLVSLLEINLN